MIELYCGEGVVVSKDAICEERNDELNEFLEERRYGMLFLL